VTPVGAREFADRVGAALSRGQGFAAGKLGVSERMLLRQEIVRRDEASPRRVRAFETALAQMMLPTSGLFPCDAAFYRDRFCPWYAGHVRRLDCIGLFPDALRPSQEIVSAHGLQGEVMNFLDQEPDRSVPADDSRCWLPHLHGRRVLLVSPFAELLRERADAATFEAVWAGIGKRWFHPAAVEAVELPYGYSPKTRARFATAIDLYEDVTQRIAQRDFDVAVIGAGGLGIPIASFVKSLDRVGVSLGGAIQPLFGVLGGRWRDSRRWRRDYLNDAWIELPDRYRPGRDAETTENYW
jgi:hypothetical protein